MVELLINLKSMWKLPLRLSKINILSSLDDNLNIFSLNKNEDFKTSI